MTNLGSENISRNVTKILDDLAYNIIDVTLSDGEDDAVVEDKAGQKDQDDIDALVSSDAEPITVDEEGDDVQPSSGCYDCVQPNPTQPLVKKFFRRGAENMGGRKEKKRKRRKRRHKSEPGDFRLMKTAKRRFSLGSSDTDTSGSGVIGLGRDLLDSVVSELDSTA